MPAPVREPQDRKPPAKKAVQRKSTPEEMRAASERALAAKAAEDGPVSGKDNDALRAEVVPPTPEPPKGMPPLLTGLDLPRRARADYFEAVDRVAQTAEKSKAAEVLTGDDVEGRLQSHPRVLTIVAATMRIAADIEDALVSVAADQDEFRKWARAASEDQLMQAWNWYQAAQGEALASPA